MAPESPSSGIVVDIRQQGDGRLLLSLAGTLDSRTLPEAWSRTVEPTRRAQARHLTIDGGKLTRCDGAGLGLFAELRRLVSTAGGQVEFVGLTGDLQRLLEMSLLEDPQVRGLEPPQPPGMVAHAGRATWLLLQDMYQIVAFVGELTAGLAWAILHPIRVRRGEMVEVAEKAGANALPVVGLLGLLMGVILAFQTADPFGATVRSR